MTVRYAIMDTSEIFNLTSPRYLPEISGQFCGRCGWLNDIYEPLRDQMERDYIAGFNAVSGHYDYLLESVAREGFRNPIMVTVGGLIYRGEWEIPERYRGMPVIEYLGGSRFWAAERLGLKVPCIINDLVNQMPDAEVLDGIDAVLSLFTDKPEIVKHRENSIVVNNLPFVHLPNPYSMGEQVQMRHKIVKQVQIGVSEWLAKND